MNATYYKIKLPCGVICTFKCFTPRQKMYLMCELLKTNYELLETVEVVR